MTQTLLLARRALVPLLALAALLACASPALADIRLQPVRSLDAQEGSVVPRDRIVSFDDAGACAPGEFSVRLDWGDGTTSTGRITFTDPLIGIDLEPIRCTYEAVGEHTYRTAATAPLSATVCRGAECKVSGGGGTARVAEAPIAGEAEEFSARAGRAYEGRVATFRDDNRLAQASDYAAVVDWGDGTTTTGRVTGDDGRFEVEGAHTYAAAGARALRVTLVQNGADRVAARTTIDVAPADDSGTAPAAAGAAPTPGRIVASTARSASRPALRVRSRSLTRRSLARGLPVRLSLPARLRSVRVAFVTATGRPRTLGTVTLRVRGGTVAGGVRTVDLRVRLSRALRRKLRAGGYAIRARAGASGLMTAQFRVR
jgi:hypothetical protein